LVVTGVRQKAAQFVLTLHFSNGRFGGGQKGCETVVTNCSFGERTITISILTLLAHPHYFSA
jgi:hypothetical protein